MIYDLGHVYIIWDIDDHNLVYYGSTYDLKTRMCTHECLKTNKCTSKQIIERGNYKYDILETHENIDEYDLVERERWYILNKVCVNKQIPHRTRAEYYQDNKEKLAEYYQDNKEKIAEYYQDNKEKIAEQQKEYYQNNKEKIADYYQDNKEKIAEYYQDNKEKIAERTKEYYQDNKEKIAERKKEYYQDNKEKIAERTKEKFVCECGGKFTYGKKSQHEKTQKHLKWVHSCKI